MNNSVKIEIFEYMEGYTIEVNGEVLMECLSSQEVSELTLGEIEKLHLQAESM